MPDRRPTPQELEEAKEEARFWMQNPSISWANVLLTALEGAESENQKRRASLLEAVGALEGIATLEPLPFEGGVDWAAIDACPDCKAYKDHPIQSGICNVHRRPMWDREKHDDREERRLGWRAKSAAREAATRLSSSLEGGEG